MTTFLLDLKHALRGLLRSPGFTFLAVLSLALGIGVNSAIFTALNSVLLRPLPVNEPSKLVRVSMGPRDESFSTPVFRELVRNQSSVELAAECFMPLSWTQGDQSRQITGSIISGSYFPTLGINPFMGRLLGPQDDQIPGGHPVAVVSQNFWKNHLAADPAVLGHTLTLNGHPFTIVGITAPSFHGDYVGMVPDLWVPLSMQAQALPDPKNNRLESRNVQWLQLFGRLRPGVKRPQAEQTLLALEEGVLQKKREARDGHIQLAVMGSLPPEILNVMNILLPALQLIVLMVLLIACSNVANLQLARAVARRQEVAMRVVLGASRAQLVRQFITESGLLSILGATGGLALGALIMKAVPSLLPPAEGVNLVFDLSMDWRVVSFALLLALTTGILFGLAPALQATRPDLVSVLKEDAAGLTVRTGLTRRIFVVAQVALSLVLLVASGLFLRSLGKANSVDPGFERSRMVLFSVNPRIMGYSQERSTALFEEIRQRAAALPGVRSVALGAFVPLRGGKTTTTYEVQGQDLPKGAQPPEANFNQVGHGYFQTMGIPVLSGREFMDTDVPGAPKVAIVNATFERKVFGGHAIGRRLVDDNKDPIEIVGVVRDVNTTSLGELADPMLYQPLSQNLRGDLTVHVATSGDPAILRGQMRDLVRGVDPYLPVNELRTMQEHLRVALFSARIGALLLGVFGTLALILATTGVYGVMAYNVDQRKKEIGIRMALGAQIRDVVRLIVSQGMRVVFVGLGIGLALAWGVSRLLSSLLFGIAATDPLTFAAITSLLIATAFLACFIPALRAARRDPMTALRNE